MADYQIFKGGWCDGHEDRIAVAQRPADGHIKPAVWETYFRLNRDTFRCSPPPLEVGDRLQLFTTLTFGLIHALGISVTQAEEGVKFKIVSSEHVDLSALKGDVYTYTLQDDKYTQTASGSTGDFTEIGAAEEGYRFFADNPISTLNTGWIGLEVVALPPDGLQWDFDMELRLHSSQPLRPPLAFLCC